MSKTIILTAGHSDGNAGASATHGGVQYREERVCLQLRDAIAAQLRVLGCRVVCDGKEGQNLPLQFAIELARGQVGPELELHLNAGSPTATGVEAFSLEPQKPFAQSIAAATASALGLRLRGDRGWKHPKDSQHKSLGICNAGAVLLEVAFVSNAYDMAALSQKSETLTDMLAVKLAAWAG